MCYKFLVVGLAFLLTSCVTTTDIKTYKKKPPLAKDAPVEVFHKEAPTFGYDLLCTATVNVKGNFVSTTLEGYVGKAKEVARECGANMALIESLQGYAGSGSNITVVIKAIQKTSKPSMVAKVVREDPDFIKKVGAAAGLGNIKNLRAILEKAKISKTKKDRAPFDSDTLSAVMVAVANNGKACSQKTLKFLATEYEAGIDTLSGNMMSARKILECPSPQVSGAVSTFKNKTEEILEVNRVVTALINQKATFDDAKLVYKNYLNMYSDIMREVDSSCNKDQTSQLCSAKPNLTRARKIIKDDLKI